MNHLMFVKKLTRSKIGEQSCFVFVEEDSNKLDEWAELRRNNEVEILRYDLTMLGSTCYTVYSFTFVDEGLTETYQNMLDL